MNLIVILAYLMILAPAITIALDLPDSRNRTSTRLAIGLAAVAVGIWMALRLNSESILVYLLIGGTLSMVYAVNWLGGLSKFTTALTAAAFLLLAVAETMPGVGLWARYKDYFLLLFNIATFIVPLLLVWHIWRQLPLFYDGMRGGVWRHDGVPLVARYRLLAAIAILALVGTVWLTYEYTESREALAYQANASLLAMHIELKELDYTIGRFVSGEEHEGDIYYVHMYLRELQLAVRRLNSIHQSIGLLQDVAQHKLAETVPDGMRKLFYEGRHDEALAVVRVMIGSIEKDFRAGGMSKQAYLSAVDSIMQAISEAGLDDYFECLCP